MENKESKADKIVNRLIRYATLAGIVVASVHLWSVPNRIDALEIEVREMRIEHGERLIEHGERLAWIEGALSSNQPAPPDSTFAPVQTGALVSASEPAPATDE